MDVRAGVLMTWRLTCDAWRCLLQIQHALRSILSTVGLRAVGKPGTPGYLRSSRMDLYQPVKMQVFLVVQM
jgi:hypothetical protein